MANYSFPIWNIATVLNHLDSNSDINMRDKDGNTALHFSCKYGRLDILNRCIAASADVNLRNIKGDTALSYASGSRENGLVCVKALLKAGADPNIGGCLLPIHQAAHIGNVDIAESLILSGALMGVRDYIGRTASEVGFVNGNDEFVSMLESIKARLYQ